MLAAKPESLMAAQHLTHSGMMLAQRGQPVGYLVRRRVLGDLKPTVHARQTNWICSAKKPPVEALSGRISIRFGEIASLAYTSDTRRSAGSH